LTSWILKVTLADLFTLGNGLLGFFAITYMLDDPPRPFMASIFILLAMVFDGLDGVAARALGSKHSVGHYLDSFGDLISFAIAPASLVYFSYYVPGRYSPTDVVAALAAFSFLVLGALRLARFARAGHELGSFSGLPTPAATFLVLMLLAFFGPAVGSLWPIHPLMVLGLAFAVSLAMVADVTYPKIRTAGLGALALAGIILAIAGFVSLETGADRTYAFAALLGSLALILAYVLVAPLVEQRRPSPDEPMAAVSSVARGTGVTTGVPRPASPSAGEDAGPGRDLED
jgi:CDP-diacylglycerol--serine O-phosphatidyltransferase